MINQLEVKNPNGAYIRFPLTDYSAGYVVEEIGGLDPVKATLVSSTFAELDGAQYNAGRREVRNITLKMGLIPNYSTNSVQSLRNNLYKYLMPKIPVTLTFFDTDGTSKKITGIVESFETPLFSQNPEVSVSIMCFDPDFTDGTTSSYTGQTVYSNSGDNSLGGLTYAGTVPTGLVLTFTPPSGVTTNDFTLVTIGADGVRQALAHNAPVQSGNTITVSTVTGNKYSQINASGQISSTLYAINATSIWCQLIPGDNRIGVLANNSNGANFSYTVSWTNRYGGL